MYFDKTNAYSMQQPLPTGFMRFLNEEELKHFDPQKVILSFACHDRPDALKK
jgi:preprotein translocase subunit Sec61beta